MSKEIMREWEWVEYGGGGGIYGPITTSPRPQEARNFEATVFLTIGGKWAARVGYQKLGHYETIDIAKSACVSFVAGKLKAWTKCA